MGSCITRLRTETLPTNRIVVIVPPKPTNIIYYTYTHNIMSNIYDFKIYIDQISHEQLQYYIIKPLSEYTYTYKYTDFNSIIIYNIFPTHFNKLFSHLCLAETTNTGSNNYMQDQDIMYPSTVSEDPI